MRSPPAAAAEIPAEGIAAAIFFLRGQKVMLDAHLAALYGVDTKALTRAVRRNMARFPSDFMFQLSNQEFADLRRQFGTSSWGGRRHLPYAFTEQGVAMLSKRSAKRKSRAGQYPGGADVRTTALESRYDSQFRSVFDAIRELMSPARPKPRPIGFAPWEDKC